MSDYHTPVLVDAVVSYLDPARGGWYLDGTVGGGGHSEALLEAGVGARVIGVDRDPAALSAAGERLSRLGARFEARTGDYADVLERLDVELSGALLDLGISSRQVDERGRGFSFQPGSPLDMRMGGGGSGGRTAAEILNEYEEADLARIFREYGEERRSWPLARRVAARRRETPFVTSDDLVSVLESLYGHRLTVQDKARIFQAVRIEVNRELESLDRALSLIPERLSGSGVLVVIAYHSLEDRRVKHAFREWSRACICPPELPLCQCRGAPLGETLTRKVVRPGPEEVAANPRSRSARLRAWRKAA